MRNPDWEDPENLLVFHYIVKFPERTETDIAHELRELKYPNGEVMIHSSRSIAAIMQHVSVLKRRKDRLFVPDPKNDDIHFNSPGKVY